MFLMQFQEIRGVMPLGEKRMTFLLLPDDVLLSKDVVILVVRSIFTRLFFALQIALARDLKYKFSGSTSNTFPSRMPFSPSPIHRILPHPTSPFLYLATSASVYKYNLQSSSIDATFTSPNLESYAQFLEITSEWLFITGGEKILRVINAHTMESVAELFPHPKTSVNNVSHLLKRASAITYDPAESRIIVADKTGEIYTFPYPLAPPLLQKYNNIKSSLPPVDEKNPLTKPSDDRFMGTFLLGHSSSVIDLTLSTAPWGGKLLVTVDRDEHVRISVFPETWIICAMGLGHTAFVSCVVTTEVDDGILSGGGDNRVILWNFNGVARAEYTITQGSCVRLLRCWKDMVVVVGERFVLFLVMRLIIVDLRLWRF